MKKNNRPDTQIRMNSPKHNFHKQGQLILEFCDIYNSESKFMYSWKIINDHDQKQSFIFAARTRLF